MITRREWSLEFNSTDQILHSAAASESVTCSDCGLVFDPMTLPLTGATVPYRLVPSPDGGVCVDCFDLRQKTGMIQGLLATSGLPNEYTKLESGVFPEQRLAMLRAWWSERRPFWVYGPRKAGKTWLMAFLCKSLCLAGRKALWRDWDTLKRAATSTYSEDTAFSDYGLLEELLRAETLFLDDLAVEDMTPARLALLKALFNAQDQHRLLIVVTSNESLVDFTGKVNALRFADDRVASRLERFRWTREGVESPLCLKGSYERTGNTLPPWESPGECAF